MTKVKVMVAGVSVNGGRGRVEEVSMELGKNSFTESLLDFKRL